MVPSDEIKKLTDLTSLITKGSTPTTYGHQFVDESKGEATFIGAYNCSFDGAAKLDTKKWITSEANEMLKRSKLTDEDSILCIVGNTIGSSLMVEPSILPANINQNVALIRPVKEKVFPLYLKYAICSPFVQWQVIKEASTQAQPSLSLKQVGDFKIFSPPLPEQRKIATILGTWDKAISTTERLIDNSKQQKKALMQQLLTGKKRLLDDSGKPFEGEWEEVKLSDVFTLSSGDTKPKNVEKEQTNTQCFPVFGGNNIMGYSAKSNSTGNVILIGRVGEYCGVTRLVQNDCWITDNALFTKKFSADFDKQFIVYLLQKFDLSRLRNKGGQPLISQKPIYGVKIEIPSLHEQQKVASVLLNADREIDVLQQQLADLRQEKKALMQQLLTGKRRVKI